MSIETKQDVLERILSQEKPKCNACKEEMSLWEVPEMAIGDGLGWGTPYLYVCFNDDCSTYKGGWDQMFEEFGQKSSYRVMNYPGTSQYELLPVFSHMGGTGQVVTDDVLKQRDEMEEATKRGFSILADCYVNQDTVQMLNMLLDVTEPPRVRLKAAEMLGDVSDTEVIEPLRYHKYGTPKLTEAVEGAIEKIHTRCFTMECPYCAEIVKKRAQVCKHCNKELK